MKDAVCCAHKRGQRKKNFVPSRVPYHALKDERKKHKKTKMMLIKTMGQFDALQLAYFNLLEESKKFAMAGERPDPTKDIVAYMRWLVAKMQEI